MQETKERKIAILWVDIYYKGEYQYYQKLLPQGGIIDNNIDKSLKELQKMLGRGYTVKVGMITYQDEIDAIIKENEQSKLPIELKLNKEKDLLYTNSEEDLEEYINNYLSAVYGCSAIYTYLDNGENITVYIIERDLTE